MKEGATNSLLDVAGLTVGQTQRVGDGWRSGVTVVLAAGEGAVGGVDVRGGAPGTRETDLLDPRNIVQRAHAVVLSGGSAYGLATATGVMEALAADGVGLPVGPHPDQLVPIVPAAVVFDIGRGGGTGRATPDAAMGADAYQAAKSGQPITQGSAGAGTGSLVGGLAGGVGTASAVLESGATVAALAVVNASGSPFDPATGMLYGAPFGLPGEFTLTTPESAEVRAWEQGERPRWFNTTIGVVATDVSLTKSQCSKMAGIAHDGLARAIRPVHTMFDGDAVFGLSTGDGSELDPMAFHQVLIAAADCFSRAVVRGVLAAEGWEGTPSYRQVFPSAVR